VIDNSSAWRMMPAKKLVVPEINGHLLTPDDRIIANPNCSTIQLVIPGAVAQGLQVEARGRLHLPERHRHGHESRGR
jgi:hypothetical protein